MIRLLIFGQSGQVARALSQVTRAHVMTLDRAAADLSNPDSCAAHIRDTDADAVINAAAWTDVDGAEAAEAAATVVNAVAPGVMARAAALRDLPFIHLSSDYVFDGSGDALWRPNHSTGPINAYGRSKLAGEQTVMAAGGLSVVLRTSWVFDGVGRNFVTTMLRLGATRDQLSIVADQIGGPTPASHIAEACVKIAEGLVAGRGAPGIYHLSGTPDTSWADFARAIFACSGQSVDVHDIATADYPTAAVRPLNSRLDCRDLQREFGITRPDWATALREICERVSHE
ncbi:dTDP-4-dehydrorhamnose reductase [Loktanella agnita]|uniref:dTDP-4-dehydrorhamnose reductase n=1 Tax=Loktanella agnita TaxID=287097 RepID=UPI0039879AC8